MFLLYFDQRTAHPLTAGWLSTSTGHSPVAATPPHPIPSKVGPAVDIQQGTGHVGRPRGQQERDGIGKLGMASGALERNLHAEFPAHVLVAGSLFRDPVSPRELSRALRVLLDDTGGDAVDAHTL